MTEICTVLDMVAEQYLEPIMAPTIAFAIRGFGEACTKEGHAFHKFPADYALYHIGQFDPKLGVLKELEPRRIAVATAFMNEGPQMVTEGTNDG